MKELNNGALEDIKKAGTQKKGHWIAKFGDCDDHRTLSRLWELTTDGFFVGKMCIMERWKATDVSFLKPLESHQSEFGAVRYFWRSGLCAETELHKTEN